MPRDREAERVRELERQHERERRWASGAASFPPQAGAPHCPRSAILFFNLSSNDLGPTVVAAAALSLLATALWGVGRLSLVSYTGDIRTGTCTVEAKELQHIHIAAPGVDFWRAALNVSLVEQQAPAKMPPSPPSPFTTCWSDGVPGPCEAPPAAPPPLSYRATAYDNLKGTYSPDKHTEQALLDQHHVGESCTCYFGYLEGESRDVLELRVVFSVTKALHAGSASGRPAVGNGSWLRAAQLGTALAAAIFCLLVVCKMMFGHWRRQAPIIEIALGETSRARRRVGGEYGAGDESSAGVGGLTWRNAGAALSLSTARTYAHLTPSE
jgi:hypothetical protein